MAENKTMLRVLITQKNEDGSIKVKNGIPFIGGVIEDNLGESLGYVFDDSMYDNDMKRKPEHFIENWLDGDKNADNEK